MTKQEGANIDRIIHVCADFVLVIVLYRSEYEHDYDREHEGFFGCGCRGVIYQSWDVDVVQHVPDGLT
jgi:hypothetical protein